MHIYDITDKVEQKKTALISEQNKQIAMLEKRKVDTQVMIDHYKTLGREEMMDQLIMNEGDADQMYSRDERFKRYHGEMAIFDDTIQYINRGINKVLGPYDKVKEDILRTYAATIDLSRRVLAEAALSNPKNPVLIRQFNAQYAAFKGHVAHAIKGLGVNVKPDPLYKEIEAEIVTLNLNELTEVA